MNSSAKTFSWILGIVLVVVGVLGFVNNPVLGLFQVDLNHNIVHLLSGVIGIIAASSGHASARMYLIIFGLIYGVVAVLGFIGGGSVLGLITVNQADNYLHSAIALVSLAVGFGAKK